MQKILQGRRQGGAPSTSASVYYCRGVLNGAHGSPKASGSPIQNHGLPVTGDKVAPGFEAMKNFDLPGIPAAHDGDPRRRP